MECHSMLNAFITNFIFKDSMMASKTVQNVLCGKAEYKTVFCMIPIRGTERGRERRARKKTHQNIKSDYICVVRLWVIFIFFLFFFSFIVQKIYNDLLPLFTVREEDCFRNNILV